MNDLNEFEEEFPMKLLYQRDDENMEGTEATLQFPH